MSALLIAEHNNKEIKPFTLNAITAASQIDQDLHVIVIGHSCETVAKTISEIPNVKKVIHVDDTIYENYLPENFTSAVIKNSENYSQIVCMFTDMCARIIDGLFGLFAEVVVCVVATAWPPALPAAM